MSLITDTDTLVGTGVGTFIRGGFDNLKSTTTCSIRSVKDLCKRSSVHYFQMIK